VKASKTGRRQRNERWRLVAVFYALLPSAVLRRDVAANDVTAALMTDGVTAGCILRATCATTPAFNFFCSASAAVVAGGIVDYA